MGPGADLKPDCRPEKLEPAVFLGPGHIGVAGLRASNKGPGFQGVPKAGSNQRSRPIQPALRHASTNQVAMAKSMPLVEAEPAMMKLQFITPPKNAATPTNAPRINPAATNNSPKIIIFENQV